MAAIVAFGALLLGLVAIGSGLKALRRSRNVAILKVRELRLKDMPKQ